MIPAEPAVSQKPGVNKIDVPNANLDRVRSELASEGKRVLFVGTKKQAQEAIRSEADRAKQYHVNNRWLGGMLTNFSTIRKSVKRLTNIEKMETDGTYDKLTKKETLVLDREKEKLAGVTGSDIVKWTSLQRSTVMASAAATRSAPAASRPEMLVR